MWHYVEVEGTPIDQVSGLIEQYAITTGVPIPVDLEEYLDELAAQAGRARERVTVVEPNEGERPVLGTVEVYNPGVNFIKRLGFSDGPFGRGLLGKLLKQSYIEIVIRESTDKPHHYNEMTVFVPAKQFNGVGARQGSLIFAVLQSYQIPGRDLIWITDTLEKVV